MSVTKLLKLQGEDMSSPYDKKMQLESPNFTYKCSTMSPGKPFIWGPGNPCNILESKYKGHESQKHCRSGSMHSCEC